MGCSTCKGIRRMAKNFIMGKTMNTNEPMATTIWVARKADGTYDVKEKLPWKEDGYTVYNIQKVSKQSLGDLAKSMLSKT
jgi:hypothetical protein